MARGYIYYVSLKGVSGASHIDTSDVEAVIARIREKANVPVGVGFGIRDGATAARIAAFADAVVVGSRFVEEIERSPAGEAPARVGAVLAQFREALASAPKKATAA